MDLNNFHDPLLSDFGDPTPVGRIIHDWDEAERLETQQAITDLLGMEPEEEGE